MSPVSLYDICLEIHNFWDVSRHFDTFTISDGDIDLSALEAKGDIKPVFFALQNYMIMLFCSQINGKTFLCLNKSMYLCCGNNYKQAKSNETKIVLHAPVCCRFD